MRAGHLTAAIFGCAALIAPACGGDDGDEHPAPAVSAGTTAPEHSNPEAPPPAAERPEADPGGAAGEASPEAGAEGPETGELSASDAESAGRAVRAYVDGLNRRNSEAVCSAFAAGALPISELPRRRGGCVGSLSVSIGGRPAGGGPAWKRTRIVEVNAVSVESGGARVTATVIHRFRDRRQPSIEEDVIYLERSGDRWLLAKPSATFYRAVGYGDPPLRALTPPG